MKTYNITVTEKQLRLISEACDTAGRIYRGIPDTVSLFDNVIWHGKKYDENLNNRRELLAHTLRMIRMLINPNNRTDECNSGEDEILYDIHQVIRNQWSKERGEENEGRLDQSVCHMGTEPLISIVVNDC